MVDVEQCETASSTSSHTLVDQPTEESPLVVMLEDQGVEKSAAAAVDSPAKQAPSDATLGRQNEGEAKMSKLTVEELAAELDKPNVGSDQMDVDEVMGNAIDHLRAAYKVSSIGGSEAAPDPIEQAFFSTFIDNRKKIGELEWNRTSRSDRWVTAYPAQSGTRDLYDALANSFDLEPLPGDLLSFTTIEKPAPHFHVCIQRSDGVRKNANPITIPETLYLDRFMHTDDTQSPLFKGRKRKWDIETRLNEMGSFAAKERLETAKPEPQAAGRPSDTSAQDDELTEEEIDGFLVIGGLDPPAQGPSMAGTAAMTNGDLDPQLKQLLKKYGVAEPEGSQTSAPTLQQTGDDQGTALPASDLDGFWERFVAEENEERERLTAERDSIFRDARQVAYRLHAVVCHAGATASAGHYWVWIHDFERDVWRKYNDTRVSVHPADFVFGELNTKGEPYYLAYVKADEVHNLVSIPRRRPQQQQQQQLAPPAIPPRPRSAQDTVMADGGGGGGSGGCDSVMPSIEHWEDVEMLPPPYAEP
jgi:ubiquitin carboxyl-terminal hydrolase 25/28